MTKRWAAFGAHSGWRKSDSQANRRRVILSHKKTYLSAYHSLDQLAKVTTDPETKRKARTDAEYFKRMHNKKKKKR